jgi:hypothetical protein
MGKTKTEEFVEVDAKLGKQTINLRKSAELYSFNVFSYLSNIEGSPLRELKKVI